MLLSVNSFDLRKKSPARDEPRLIAIRSGKLIRRSIFLHIEFTLFHNDAKPVKIITSPCHFQPSHSFLNIFIFFRPPFCFYSFFDFQSIALSFFSWIVGNFVQELIGDCS